MKPRTLKPEEVLTLVEIAPETGQLLVSVIWHSFEIQLAHQAPPEGTVDIHKLAADEGHLETGLHALNQHIQETWRNLRPLLKESK